MPSTAQTLQYADLIQTDVAVDNQVNLVDYDQFGHRVSVDFPLAQIQDFFKWTRASGSSRPIGHINTDAQSAFIITLIDALNSRYTDIDAVSGKLSYDSIVFDTNTDIRVRENGVSTNDLVLAYVLYKVYGTSAITTQSKLFNLEDAWGMLRSADVADSVIASFTQAEALAVSSTTNEKGAVDAMFRDLLALDPQRFFDSTGKQIPGLFETSVDAESSGTWQLVEGDILEIRIEFTFQNKVTLRTTRDVSQTLGGSTATTSNSETTYISAGEKFYIRLQLNIKDTVSYSSQLTTLQTQAATYVTDMQNRYTTLHNNTNRTQPEIDTFWYWYEVTQGAIDALVNYATIAGDLSLAEPYKTNFTSLTTTARAEFGAPPPAEYIAEKSRLEVVIANFAGSWGDNKPAAASFTFEFVSYWYSEHASIKSQVDALVVMAATYGLSSGTAPIVASLASIYDDIVATLPSQS